MATSENSPRRRADNPRYKVDLDQLRQEASEDKEARRADARRLGREVAARAAALAPPTPSVLFAGLLPPSRRPVREPRAATWRGPHAGEKFRTAKGLAEATIEECTAGVRESWGIEFTPLEKEIFLAGVKQNPGDAFEQEARKAYQDLRSAIAKVTALAERSHSQTFGAATVMLGVLWGNLPELPETTELPGYVKGHPERRRLTDEWQAYARRMLCRELQPRELAELSIVLGVGPSQPYTAFFSKDARAAHVGVTVATVLKAEAKRLEKFADETAPP